MGDGDAARVGCLPGLLDGSAQLVPEGAGVARDDIIVGAYENDDGGTDAGKAYLILSNL